ADAGKGVAARFTARRRRQARHQLDGATDAGVAELVVEVGPLLLVDLGSLWHWRHRTRHGGASSLSGPLSGRHSTGMRRSGPHHKRRVGTMESFEGKLAVVTGGGT